VKTTKQSIQGLLDPSPASSKLNNSIDLISHVSDIGSCETLIDVAFSIKNFTRNKCPPLFHLLRNVEGFYEIFSEKMDNNSLDHTVVTNCDCRKHSKGIPI
jgi:hypothetical protein